MAHAGLRILPLVAAVLLLPPGWAQIPSVPAPGTHDLSWANDVKVSPDGLHVYAAGRQLSAQGLYDVKVVAYSLLDGTEEWSTAYNGPQTSVEWGVSLAASPDGDRLAVTGFSSVAGPQDQTLHTDMLLLVLDALGGKVLWEHRYHGPRAHASWAVGQGAVFSNDGSKLYATGLTLPDGLVVNVFAFNFTTFAFDAASGNVTWMGAYNGQGNVEDWGYAIALSPDQRRVVVTGRSYGGPQPSWDYATVSYNATTGAQEWASRFDSKASRPVALPYGPALGDWSSSLGFAPDGATVFVTGRSQTDDSNYDYATVAYDAASGAQRWLTRYDGPGHYEDGAYALAVSPDGQRVFVTGWSASANVDGSMDFATVAYEAQTGRQLWASRYDASGGSLDDAALALQVAPDGSRVYAAGWSFDGQGRYDYATVAYDAVTGKERWVARHDGRPGNSFDFATRFNGMGDDTDMVALALSPDGKSLFLAGSDVRMSFLVGGIEPGLGTWVWDTAGLQGTFAAPAAPVRAASEPGPAPARTPGPEALVCLLILAGVSLLRAPRKP
ncbi:MAG: PQQ-like beta-propeller repeat protein [Halobacteriales archaeon]|nr:PQQ-like beta-propeller repeat protein [Halobacteriales archaeon]